MSLRLERGTKLRERKRLRGIGGKRANFLSKSKKGSFGLIFLPCPEERVSWHYKQGHEGAGEKGERLSDEDKINNASSFEKKSDQSTENGLRTSAVGKK